MNSDFYLGCWLYFVVLFLVVDQIFAGNQSALSENDVFQKNNELVNTDSSFWRKEPLHSSRLDLTSIAPSLDVVLTGVSTGDKLGYSVSLGGDVNFDAKADILIGAPGRRQNAGMAYMLYGGTTLASATLDNLLAVQGMAIDGIGPGYGTGWSVDLGGDVNGDGFADIMIGAPLYSSNTGQAYIIYGRTDLPEYYSLEQLNTDDGITITGPAVNHNAGNVVSLRSDINQDGRADPVVSAYGFSNSRGKVYYFLGTSSPGNVDMNNIPIKQDVVGGHDGYQAGFSVASGGDANGDNKKDTLIGSPLYSTLGAAYLIYGGSDWDITSLLSIPTSKGISIIGAASGCKAGSAVAIGGDVNGDAIGDFVIGAPGCASGRGSAYLLYGGAAMTSVGLAGLSPSRGIAITGENAGDGFGSSVGVGGDFNGDNHADIVIGAPGYASSTGAVYLIYGTGANLANIAVSSLTTAQGLKIIGESPNSFTGFALSLHGDTNFDGKVDLLIGAYGYDNNRGRVYLIYGASGLETINLGRPTSQPVGQPTCEPTSQPSCQPVSRPSSQPTKQPFALPSSQPTGFPSGQPTRQPSSQPSGQPSSRPLCFPTSQPSVKPSNRPSSQPSCVPSGQPTEHPTDGSTAQPSARPSTPSSEPSTQPTAQPTKRPTIQPSTRPSGCPSSLPTNRPSDAPSSQPSEFVAIWMPIFLSFDAAFRYS
jgi:hypothetical protein